MNKLKVEHFEARIVKLKEAMRQEGLDACLIYGDEYRRESLRYVSNFWPLFERGALIVPIAGEPILLAAPEGEVMCKEMSVWPDIRFVPDFSCVTVPDEIEYPHANYTSFQKVFEELRGKGTLGKIGIVGMDAMPHTVYIAIRDSVPGSEVVDANSILFDQRLFKTSEEIACLKEAARIADSAYKALLQSAKPGVTELQLAAAAHEAAYQEGAEYIPFCLVSSGERVATIIGRATQKVVEDGDMVMAALAVQYEGYIATINFPFVVGAASEQQKKLIDLLIEANERGKAAIKPGTRMADMVKKVKHYFREQGVSRYDLYPPLHGCGVAEAESPYPNESSTGMFLTGMTVNTDISLFGHPDGSNRIEECFVVTSDGHEPMSQLVGELSRQWLTRRELTLGALT